MPYIKKQERRAYYAGLVELERALEQSDWQHGHVVYIFYRIVTRWFGRRCSFATICAIRGVLSSTLTEFDRRCAADYEDLKLKENGDV